jgi:hypothetical protein
MLWNDRCIQRGKELIGTRMDLPGVRWFDPEQGAVANAKQILVASGLISS